MTPYEKLDALYATLPNIECKKLCGRSNCGPIRASLLETKRIEEKTGHVEVIKSSEYHAQFQAEQNLDCQFLLPVLGTCRVYTIRPLVCRLFGCVNVPYMRCPHGCQPDRWLTEKESRQIFEEVLEIQDEARNVFPK